MIRRMLSVNRKKLCAKIMWHDYVKGEQNLEKCIIDLFYWVKNLGKLDDHIKCSKDGIDIEWIWFYGVSKHIGRLVVKLKAIKYKKDFFCYLSFYSDLDLQVTCFWILFFRPHIFRFFFLGRMPLGFCIKYISPSFGS